MYVYMYVCSYILYYNVSRHVHKRQITQPYTTARIVSLGPSNKDAFTNRSSSLLVFRAVTFIHLVYSKLVPNRGSTSAAWSLSISLSRSLSRSLSLYHSLSLSLSLSLVRWRYLRCCDFNECLPSFPIGRQL